MIVYNVNRRWFTMKADAEAYRKAEGLPPSGTFKLSIDSREELAALLNGLCALEAEPYATTKLEAYQALPATVRDFQMPDDANVPRFLKEAWGKIMAKA